MPGTGLDYALLLSEVAQEFVTRQCRCDSRKLFPRQHSAPRAWCICVLTSLEMRSVRRDCNRARRIHCQSATRSRQDGLRNVAPFLSRYGGNARGIRDDLGCSRADARKSNAVHLAAPETILGCWRTTMREGWRLAYRVQSRVRIREALQSHGQAKRSQRRCIQARVLPKRIRQAARC